MGNLPVCENYRGISFTLLTMHSYPDRYMCVGRNLLILLCLPFEGERRLVSVVPIDYKIPAINQDIHDSWRFLINSRAKAYTLSLFTLRFTFIQCPEFLARWEFVFIEFFTLRKTTLYWSKPRISKTIANIRYIYRERASQIFRSTSYRLI